MNSLKNLLAIFLLHALPGGVFAQRLTVASDNRSKTFVERYTDSLRMAQQALDMNNTSYNGDSTKLFVPKGKYAPLFLPPTYYGKIGERMLEAKDFSQDIATNALARTLLYVYLHRPDLVQTTDDYLNKIGPSKAIDKPLVAVNKQLPIEKVSKIEEPKPEAPDIKVYKPNFWTYHGDFYLQFIQNYISDNWYKGGESNYSAVGAVTLAANYNNKQKVKWDNKLEMKLGIQTSQTDNLHKLKTSEDLLRYTGKLGFQATKKWYYTIQLIGNTQFLRGFKNNDPFVYSAFANPLNVNLSLGMDYNVEWFNKRLVGSIHMAPLAYNFKYVSRLSLSERNGLDAGHHTLHNLGSECTFDLQWNFSDRVKWQTRLYGYTTYRRSEIEWENTFILQFSRYLSSNIFIYPRFDDAGLRDHKFGYWQIKEYASFGIAYSF